MRFNSEVNLGQILIAVSFAAGGVTAASAFIYGTRQDIALLEYRLHINDKNDEIRAGNADEFRRDVLQELRNIRDEISKLRLELQDKEPRRR